MVYGELKHFVWYMVNFEETQWYIIKYPLWKIRRKCVNEIKIKVNVRMRKKKCIVTKNRNNASLI